MSLKNSLPKGFLKKYRIVEKEGVKYIALNSGYLKLEYDKFEEDQPVLFLASFVLKKNKYAVALGNRLEFSISKNENENDEVTFISEYGVSGLQWSNGRVFWGHTYDDDSPPPPGRKINLDEWVDECIDRMINPSDDLLEEYRRIEEEEK